MTWPFQLQTISTRSRFWLGDIAELAAIALFVAGLAVSLAGMHETHLTAQAAIQVGGFEQ